MPRPVVTIALCFLLGVASAAEHELRIPDPPRRHVHVESYFQSTTEVTTLAAPTWLPGSYLIREFSRHFDPLTATAADGTPLTIEQLSKNRWQVVNRSKPFSIRYRVYANELSVRQNYVGEDLAILNPAALLLFLPDRRQAQSVRLEAPSRWPHQVSGMERVGDRWQAPDYRALIDAPIVVGNAESRIQHIAGRDFHFHHFGDTDRWDVPRANAQLAQLMSRMYLFWGAHPRRDAFQVINVIGSGRGAIEHDRSTLVLASRLASADRTEHVNWLIVLAHEFFHIWNGRALRPRELIDVDLEREVYSELLWFVEGVTSYYSELMVARAGLMHPDEYYQRLAADIRELELTPGANIRSLSAASRDAWVRHYRPSENSINSTVSYYLKGKIAALVLDARIREMTQGGRSLDDVIRALYQSRADSGFTRADLIAATGTELAPWFDHHIDSAAPLPTEAALGHFGLRLNRRFDPDPRAPLARDGSAADLGIFVKSRAGTVTIDKVPEGSAGYTAGLAPDDEIIAIDGYRITDENFEPILQTIEPDEDVAVLVARRGKLLELIAQPRAAPTTVWAIEEVSNSQHHRERRADWLGSGWFPSPR